MAKPTGTLGINKVIVQENGTVAHSFEKIIFSKTKDEIEAMMVDSFISSMNALMLPHGIEWFMSNPVPNIENDFDFTVTLPNGNKAWLELMEIAPLHLFGGYEKVPPKYKPYELAQIILEMIMKKAVRYSGAINRELHLLTYITHWGFIPSKSIIELLQYFLGHQKHPFNGIYLFMPIEQGVGDGRVIFPIDSQQMIGFDPALYKENEVINLDPTKWSLESPTK